MKKISKMKMMFNEIWRIFKYIVVEFWNGFKYFTKSLISTSDSISSKRVIGVAAFVLMCISYSFAIISEIVVPDYMWEGFLYIVLAAFFGNVVEKFRRKRHQGDDDESIG